jgi:hypothetical protein
MCAHRVAADIGKFQFSLRLSLNRDSLMVQ